MYKVYNQRVQKHEKSKMVLFLKIKRGESTP